jgi:hypothetical protein
MKLPGGVMRSTSRSQVVGAAYPDAALEGLEAHAHALGTAHGLGAAGYLAVRKIRLYQIDQGGTGLARIRRRQRMRENARLNLIARGSIAEHSALEAVEDHEDRTQCVVGHIAGAAGAAHEFQMQQAAHAPAFVMQAKRQSPVQVGDHEHGLWRDMKGVRCDRYFSEIFCQMGDPLLPPRCCAEPWNPSAKQITVFGCYKKELLHRLTRIGTH